MRGGAWSPGPVSPLDPADTIVVTGGTGVASVDAAGVRLAAARVAGAADGLRRAAALSGSAWASVVDGAPAAGLAALGVATAIPVPGAAGLAERPPVPGLEAEAMRRAASGAVGVVTAGLRDRAEVVDLLGWRLLRVAGLYEEAEGLVERLVGGLVAAQGFVIGAAAGLPPVVRLLGGAYRLVGIAAEGRSEGHPDAGRRRTAGGFGGAVARGIAPWTDELAYGFGHGLARSTGARPGIPGAAGTVADAVRAAPLGALGQGVRLDRVGPADFAGAPPAWRDRGARSLDEALSRIDDLSPRRGAPEATIAVQRVAGLGDAASWVVLVPGTQSVTPAAHPWDGLTDLELVAEHPDQVTAAVEAAMDDAGVGPDEPVVLVGHSLGGIAVTALASRPAFTERHRIAGVVTAGSPVATFRTPPGVPVLHLETAEEIVSAVDGGSSKENPHSPDRVTVGRSLAASPAAADRAVGGDVSAAHSIRTHARTLALAREAGDVRVAAVAERIEPYLRGEHAETAFYRAERAHGAPARVSPGAAPGPAGSP